MVAVFRPIEDAAEAVLAVTSQLRPSMAELMDRTSVNAVEDFTKMGLDRTAEALLILRSDAHGNRPGAPARHPESFRGPVGGVESCPNRCLGGRIRLPDPSPYYSPAGAG